MHRRLSRAVVAVATTALVVAGLPASSSGDTLPVPLVGSVEIKGRGFGHGIGMSQWGAQGAATNGLAWRDIIAFYYPGTSIASQGNPKVRVGITIDNDGLTEVVAQPGVRLTVGTEAPQALPSGASITKWAVVKRTGGLGVIYWDSTKNAWQSFAPLGHGPNDPLPAPVLVDNPSMSRTRLVLPSGTRRDYPGAVGANLVGSSVATVNVTAFDDYVAGVVGSEVPTSWHVEALRSQSVAARTYAAWEKAHPRSSLYDVCDTTSCQYYRGLADFRADGTLVADYRSASVTSAVTATAGQIAVYGGQAALTMFSSSNGGWSVDGGKPYLVAKADPYDDLAPGSSASWSISGSTGFRSKIEAAYPSVGSLRQLVVTRDGNGRWGGRIVSARIVGTAGEVTGVTGERLRSILGVRSAWFTLADTDHLRRDVTADGVPDVFSVSQWGTLFRVPGRASTTDGSFGTPTALGSNWQTLDLLEPAGDLDGNGRGDLLGRVRATGQRVCYPTTSDGRFVTRAVVPGTWTGYGALSGVGDLTSDGLPDFVGVRPDGHLLLFAGNGTCGGWSSSRDLGPGWGAMDRVVGIGDADGDGDADLLAREAATGVLWLYPGNGTGTLLPRVRLGGGWDAMTDFGPVGDLLGDGGVDLLARDRDGVEWVYPGIGSGAPVTRTKASLHPSFVDII